MRRYDVECKASDQVRRGARQIGHPGAGLEAKASEGAVCTDRPVRHEERWLPPSHRNKGPRSMHETSVTRPVALSPRDSRNRRFALVTPGPAGRACVRTPYYCEADERRPHARGQHRARPRHLDGARSRRRVALATRALGPSRRGRRGVATGSMSAGSPRSASSTSANPPTASRPPLRRKAGEEARRTNALG